MVLGTNRHCGDDADHHLRARGRRFLRARSGTPKHGVVATDRPHEFAITADGLGVHAERAFTVSPSRDGRSTVVTSYETQVGPLPWFGRLILAPRLHAAKAAMFEDLARAAMK